MSPQINDNYSEIRQIIVDAIEPLKEQLREIAASLKEDYARKDVINPQLDALRKQLEDLQKQALSAPKRYLVYTCTIAGLISTILTIASPMPR